MTAGQSLALEQLQAIAANSAGRFEVLDAQPWAGGFLLATLSITCLGFPRAKGGLRLRPRERFLLCIHPDFPFVVPSVETNHTRFAGFPHMQWGRQLCLYAAPAVEWSVGDGMFGLVDRLRLWLERAAQNDLDPDGVPLHPPVAYAEGPGRRIVVQCDTPAVPAGGWFGLAHLRLIGEHRADIVGWSNSAADAPEDVGAAMLLDQPLPFEMPKTFKELLAELERRGVSTELVFASLRLAALHNRADQPLYVVLGTPARGTRGTGTVRQHLLVWHISATVATGLKNTLLAFSKDEELQQIATKIDALIREWAEVAAVHWCRLMENRPEVTNRRDQGSPLTWCADRTVMVLGCGALGGHVAEWLARASCRKLILCDEGLVTPGLLVRQPFEELDIGQSKARALANRLKRIRPDMEVDARHDNVIIGTLKAADWTGGADLIVDATASALVLEKLEQRRMTTARRVPIVSLAIDRHAERGMAVLATAAHSGGPRDATRRLKLEVCNRPDLRGFADAFWPEAPTGDSFLPEPGCSSPTFVGSGAEVAALAGTLLTWALKSLRDGSDPAAGHLICQPWAAEAPGARTHLAFNWPTDLVVRESRTGYQVRIAWRALAEMQAWSSRCRRTATAGTETGGLLFGERNDALGVVWVSEVIGPPPDSQASPYFFLCGVEGTREANEEKRQRSRRSVEYVGLWHTHPGGPPLPSEIDLQGMAQVVTSTNPSTPRSLMVIVGGAAERPALGAYLFTRAEAQAGVLNRRRVHSIVRAQLKPQPATIGLALSGGGSRAIAFHLGCLRALHDRGVLERVRVVSAVSGGAIIAGMYAYSHDAFESFDQRVTDLLRQGLVGGIARRAFLSPLVLADIATSISAGAAAIATDTARAVVGTGLALARQPKPPRLEDLQPPLRRWVSRTTAFEHTLRDRLFQDRVLTSLRREGLEVVINACELRSGSAFRFGSRESGSWRQGRIVDNASVPLSHAVAASAAYPILLPALDREYRLLQRDGSEVRRRVLLTDGGVYDNLGVTCLEPGRSDAYSTNNFPVEYIICCNAGHGLFDARPVPYWWGPRLSRSFQSVFRKAQDAGQTRLHQYAMSGQLRGFVLSYLGQQDRQLPYIPPDLVRREEVASYPTDFSPMSQKAIELLTARGERLTRVLLDHYCSSL